MTAVLRPSLFARAERGFLVSSHCYRRSFVPFSLLSVSDPLLSLVCGGRDMGEAILTDTGANEGS